MNDLDLHSRSQVYEKTETCAVILLEVTIIMTLKLNWYELKCDGLLRKEDDFVESLSV